VRKATLASILAKAASGSRMKDHIEADGTTVFALACRMGLEGIVSKRKDSHYRSGRSPDWLKSKNPACAAVKREGRGGLGRKGRGDSRADGRATGASPCQEAHVNDAHVSSFGRSRLILTPLQFPLKIACRLERCRE